MQGTLGKCKHRTLDFDCAHFSTKNKKNKMTSFYSQMFFFLPNRVTFKTRANPTTSELTARTPALYVVG
jgi:hypothetical protein